MEAVVHEGETAFASFFRGAEISVILGVFAV